jgi:hypothetical protein
MTGLLGGLDLEASLRGRSAGSPCWPYNDQGATADQEHQPALPRKGGRPLLSRLFGRGAIGVGGGTRAGTNCVQRSGHDPAEGPIRAPGRSSGLIIFAAQPSRACYRAFHAAIAPALRRRSPTGPRAPRGADHGASGSPAAGDDRRSAAGGAYLGTTRTPGVEAATCRSVRSARRRRHHGREILCRRR